MDTSYFRKRGRPTSAERYNYESFTLAMDAPGIGQWSTDAPKLGDEAPDFALADTNGNGIRLSGLRGRPVVLEFGSYTCPIFTGHIPTMEEVSHRHPEAAFLVVYVREAHPGEVTPHHRNHEDKRNAVDKLLRAESITRTLLIDDIEGTVHRKYGGAWDPVYVIGPDGRILLRRAWNRPEDVEAVLERLQAGEDVQATESVAMSPPTTRPFGEGLLRGGERALLDFYDSAPPPLRERLRNSESEKVRSVLHARRGGGASTTP
jgi:hypothetical protein